jgi:hypothetical protein
MISYLPTFMPNKVLIVGGGGTGGRLVSLLAQFLKTCAWIPNPEITIVDDDVVEEKNLLRQNFIASDVGKPKAQVLAQRYSRAFNIPITPVLHRITEQPNDYYDPNSEKGQVEAVLNEVFAKHSNNSIVVMCVDSPEARRHIVGRLMYLMGNNNVLLLDSGNENDFGQVSLSTAKIPNYRYELSTLESWGNTVPGDLTIPLIPFDLNYYENMVAETTLSCADLDQTMAINCMMANTMFGIIQNFYYAKPLSYHRINVSLSHGLTPEYINPRFLIRTGSGSNNYVRLSHKFNQLQLQVPQVSIHDQIREFHATTVAPMKIAMKKAEMENKKMEEAKLEAIKQQAVQDAMKLHGWTMPKKEVAKSSEDTLKVSEAVIDALSAKPASKAAVKRVVAKKAANNLSDYLVTYEEKDVDWE